MIDEPFTVKERAGSVELIFDHDGATKARAYVSTQDGDIRIHIEDNWLTPEQAFELGKALYHNLYVYSKSRDWEAP